MGNTGSKLKRDRQPMPAFVEEALRSANLLADYRSRPEYQQNDYLGWINQAKKQETKNRRLQQMLEELDKGGVYMKMSHPASAKQ
ncbi:YdeI/OmpD-associated family protein [Thiosocius teredinicola]|uniref:YdeI/OmpD-associated family protein n=1 Tax=Thiosocius teredinicola TaxID=1973002 RepID=UPI000990DFBF